MLQPQPKPYCSHAIQRERAAAAQVERGDGVARLGEQAHCSVGDGDETSKVEARYPRLLFGQPPLVRSDKVVRGGGTDRVAVAALLRLQLGWDITVFPRQMQVFNAAASGLPYPPLSHRKPTAP